MIDKPYNVIPSNNEDYNTAKQFQSLINYLETQKIKRIEDILIYAISIEEDGIWREIE